MKPVDPEKQAAIRGSLKWVPFSYGALFAGLAWMLFARNHWPGSRGLLLGGSGMLIAIVLGSAGSIALIKAAEAGRRFLGVRYSTLYTAGRVVVALSAVLLFVLAVAQPGR
jgi:Ca2+/Na+ antiporter